MIGIIVTGHGGFAPGMLEVVTLIAGSQECCKAVPFVPTDSIETLTENLSAAWDELDCSCEGVLVFCDLPGGSPFNVAMRLKLQRSGASEVLAGVNAPMLLSAAMERAMGSSLEALAEEALNAGKESMLKFVPLSLDDDEVEEE